MGIKPLGISSDSNLKLLLFPSFCSSSRKIPFAALFYFVDILFYFIHVYIAPGKEETSLGTFFFFMEAERSCHFDHWFHVSKNSSAL